MHCLLALLKRRGTKTSIKDDVATVERLDTKQRIVHTRKARKKRTQKTNLTKKRHRNLKRTVKERARLICQKLNVYNCGEMGHFAPDCLKPRKNANIAQENEQNRKLAELMDLGDNSVCEECAIICTDAYSDEEYKEMVVYGDQGITSRKFDKDMCGDLMNTDSDKEPVVKYNVALCAQDSVSLEKK